MNGRLVRSTGAEMERRYRNVGLVAVAAAQLEETAALIVYAKDGGWDNSDEHLKKMASSPRLRTELGKVVKALPGDNETAHVNLKDGSRRVERGEVKCRLDTFKKALTDVTNERNRIVHSVAGQHLWDPEVLAVHPRGVKAGCVDARRALPTDEEVTGLVERIDDLIREGRHLMGRVAALSPEQSRAV